MDLALRSTDLSPYNGSVEPTGIGNSPYVQASRGPVSAPKTDLHLYLRGSDFMQSLSKTYSNVQNLKPLEQVFEVLTQKIDPKKGGEQETNAVIQRALKKENGYCIRLFSNESWAEWVEDKTALGQVVSLFTNYCESSKPLISFIKRLDEKIIEKANSEAVNLLSSLKEKRSIKENSSGCELGLLLGSGLTLATQNPVPLGLAALNCLEGVKGVVVQKVITLKPGQSAYFEGSRKVALCKEGVSPWDSGHICQTLGGPPLFVTVILKGWQGDQVLYDAPMSDSGQWVRQERGIAVNVENTESSDSSIYIHVE
ncbi:MAG: hypothetical protein JSR80_05515 [Verrucomicrobia bacterium]|nr:hypothetical protein [Verrucomicrobiota bacterium]